MRKVLSEAGQDFSRPKTIPAPIGGWNTANSLADMNAKDAVFLDNFFPQTSDVRLRKGTTLRATVTAGQEIRTLLGYKSTTGTSKVFAAGAAGLYDVTAGDTTTVVSAATSAEWQYTNVTTAGGSFLWMCNGVDKSRIYNGASWTLLDDVSTPAITGIVSTDIVNVSKFKTRLILCKKNSLSFFYLPNNAIGGAATEFPLGALFTKGGYLVATDSWTKDGGNGPDDYFIAITSEGEVAMYQGTDPSSASTFALVGVFQLPAPMNRRCFTRIGGELCVLTKSGMLPLSKALFTDDKSGTALSRKIERAFQDYATLFSTNYGWQPVYFPEASMLLVNVPILKYPARNVMYAYQFVMNTMTGAWCRFLNMNAECWLAHDGKLYYALFNKVYEAWTGTDDLGSVIEARAKTAFTLLSSAYTKHIKMVRPLITADASVELQLGIDVDYEDNRFNSSLTSYPQAVAKWDQDKFNEAKWNGSPAVLAKWRTVSCKPGRSAATRLRVSAKNVTMTWIATDLILSDGSMRG